MDYRLAQLNKDRARQISDLEIVLLSKLESMHADSQNLGGITESENHQVIIPKGKCGLAVGYLMGSPDSMLVGIDELTEVKLGGRVVSRNTWARAKKWIKENGYQV